MSIPDGKEISNTEAEASWKVRGRIRGAQKLNPAGSNPSASDASSFALSAARSVGMAGGDDFAALRFKLIPNAPGKGEPSLAVERNERSSLKHL